MDKVLHEIRKLEEQEDSSELGGYLIKLVKNDENAIRYEEEFAKHLQSENWYLKKAAVFALLFALQIDNKNYREAAIEFVKNEDEDDEVRRWSAAGLGQTYQNTKDKELLKLLIELVDIPGDVFRLKTTFLSTALLIFGLSTREQFFGQSSVLPSIDKMQELFSVEIKSIRELIS